MIPFINSKPTITLSISLCALSLSLMGCSTTSETFDCKAGQGVGCKSISEINHRIDQGTLGSSVDTRMLETRLPEKGRHPGSLPFPGIHVSTPVISPGDSTADDSVNKRTSLLSEISLSDTLSVRRIPEQSMRVWIAPYQDGQGNFHEGNIVHTVVKPSFWQINNTNSRVIDPQNADIKMTNSSLSHSNPELDTSQEDE